MTVALPVMPALDRLRAHQSEDTVYRVTSLLAALRQWGHAPLTMSYTDDGFSLRWRPFTIHVLYDAVPDLEAREGPATHFFMLQHVKPVVATQFFADAASLLTALEPLV